MSLCVYLHGDSVCERGNTLQGLVSTAATTSSHRHAGWDKEMVRLTWQLPPNLHQSVPRLTAAPRINLQPPPHWGRNTDKINTVMILFISSMKDCRILCRNRERTFSAVPGFWGVCWPPVSKLEGEIKILKRLM